MRGVSPLMTECGFKLARDRIMSTTVSPLAPKTVPDMPPIGGVRLATAAAGVRYQGRTDVMLAVFDEGASVAGVFTRSKCPSAPVEWCRARIKNGRARALVVKTRHQSIGVPMIRPGPLRL